MQNCHHISSSNTGSMRLEYTMTSKSDRYDNGWQSVSIFFDEDNFSLSNFQHYYGAVLCWKMVYKGDKWASPLHPNPTK